MTIHGWEVLSVVIAATFALIGVGEWFYRRSLIDAALHQNRLRAVIRAIRAETSCGVEVDFSIELRRP